MAEPVRVAVVGSGYFGRFHAKNANPSDSSVNGNIKTASITSAVSCLITAAAVSTA